MTRRTRLVGLAAVGAALVGLVAIYVKGTGPGNGEAAACAGAVETARALEPFAKGEVAAFQPAERPAALAATTFADAGGGRVSLADFSGRTVLVNFWATWCVPCREEMPALDRLARAMDEAEFSLVAIDADPRDTERSRAFLAEIGATGIDYYADEGRAVFQALRAQGLMVGLPTTLLLDGKGCLLGAMSGPAEWDSADGRALVMAAIRERIGSSE